MAISFDLLKYHRHNLIGKMCFFIVKELQQRTIFVQFVFEFHNIEKEHKKYRHYRLISFLIIKFSVSDNATIHYHTKFNEFDQVQLFPVSLVKKGSFYKEIALVPVESSDAAKLAAKKALS
ncbi:hypothetical protein BpHYR1_024738 [Brachionus plicatilis]|uniref:Uncharacterized protein n=1 Tax=Brachionus plicatilis TaxID=10195 RepID=A0A3M7P930_BRAPC|nr:hypothetical protein BpHYR1_024738 [Brachionus plicatilis]